MKAIVEIDFPNLRGFDETGILKEGNDTYFKVFPGETLNLKLKEHGFTDEEVAEYQIRILKGNPRWVSLETDVEKETKKNVDLDKVKEVKRYDELERLNKKEQSELLKKLGIKEKDIPSSEPDRIALIMKLEKK